MSIDNNEISVKLIKFLKGIFSFKTIKNSEKVLKAKKITELLLFIVVTIIF